MVRNDLDHFSQSATVLSRSGIVLLPGSERGYIERYTPPGSIVYPAGVTGSIIYPTGVTNIPRVTPIREILVLVTLCLGQYMG